MKRNYLLKVLFLLMVLSSVAAAIFMMMRSNSGSNGAQSAGADTFFRQFVTSGGPIVWFILVPMSLGMVYLAAEYCLIIRRKVMLPLGADEKIIRLARETELKRLATEIGQSDDIVSVAVAKALSKGVDDWFRMRETMFESIQDRAIGLMRRVEWINLIGNVSPMVGLFGTVVGMIQLFNTMAAAGGQPQPAQLAGGISVALVTTFWGLLIAIPALATYGIFRNRVEMLANEAMAQGEEILAQVRRVLRKRMEASANQAQTARPVPARSSEQVRRPSQQQL